MTISRRSQQSMFGDGLEPRATLWRTPSSQEPGVNPERLVDKDGNRPTHFNQRLYDRETGRMAQHSLTQDVVIAGFSAQATHASRSATPGSGPERMTPGTSGHGFIDCLPDFRTTSRIGLFSRMFVGTSAWGSTVCSMTWKASATPRGRSLYLLRVSARSTGGTGFGSSDAGRMFMTPKAGDADFQTPRTSGRPPEMSTHLATQVVFNPPERMWPTPHASCGTGAGDGGRAGGLNLQTAVDRMWPTPRAGKVTDENEEAWRARNEKGDVATPPLSLAVKMWPTPTVQDGANTAGVSQFERNTPPLNTAVADKPGQKLNPDFVERLMGFPSGWTVLED